MRLFDMDSKKDYLLDGKYKVCTPYAPCVDVVEVVRCRDCKHKRLYDEGNTKYYYCALEDRPNRNWSVDDTDYCSWGEERREP